MVAAVQLMKVRYVPCFAHTLDLVVMDVLKEIHQLAAVRKKIRAIDTHFHSSVKSSEELENAQRQQGSESDLLLKLIKEVDTRWNSTFYMLQRYLQLHTQFTTALCVVQKNDMYITGQELSQMCEAVDALRRFKWL